jgi:hypothetical protein
MEQYAAQALGITSYAAAHAYASQQESAFAGWMRGAQANGTMLPNGMAYVDVRYTRGTEKMDVRVTVNPQTWDVDSVVRIPVP